jgi:hypothetical protein
LKPAKTFVKEAFGQFEYIRVI